MQTNWQKQALVLVVLIAAISFCAMPVSAAPPFTTATASSNIGLDIAYNEPVTHKANTSMQFVFHMFNISNGVPIINRSTNPISCTFHLYNSTGQHIFIEDPIQTFSDGYDYEVKVAGGNFSTIGNYFFIVGCNSSNLGGAVKNIFVVTNTGSSPPGDNLTIFMIIATIAVIGGMIYLLFYTIQNGLLADVDLKMLGMNMISYFALFVLLFANQTYIGDVMAKKMIDLFIKIGALNNIIIPTLLFIFSYMKAKGLHKFLKSARID